jgi:hypothetical protein
MGYFFAFCSINIKLIHKPYEKLIKNFDARRSGCNNYIMPG